MENILKSTYFASIQDLITNYQMAIVLISIAIFLFKRDLNSLRYSVLLMLFFIIGYITYPWIMAYDYGFYVYRYVYWALIDILFIAILAYWALKDKVYIWQSVIGQLVVLPAPILQLFRLVDRHYMDLSYSTYLYKTLLPLVNSLSVLVCFLPLLLIYKQKNKNSLLKK